MLSCSQHEIPLLTLPPSQNIEKAKERIAKLDSEEEDNEDANGVNGKSDEAVESVTKDLKETTVEENQA